MEGEGERRSQQRFDSIGPVPSPCARGREVHGRVPEEGASRFYPAEGRVPPNHLLATGRGAAATGLAINYRCPN